VKAIDAYPLAWPAGWPRTKAADRRYSRFNTKEPVYRDGVQAWKRTTDVTVAGATARVLTELAHFGAERGDVVISTNIELRRDGLPRSDRRPPDDPGVAVYWERDRGDRECMAIDLYTSVAGNLAAVAATIDAMRAIERHGGAQILKRAFQGFKALPSSTTPALNVETAAQVVASRAVSGPALGGVATSIIDDEQFAREYIRRAAAKAHPDAGGRAEDFQLVQEAKRVLSAHHGAQL
jgi:hypothetical protein